MARLFADPGFRGARTTGPPPEVRFLRDDVAIAHSYQEVTGQVLRSGVTLPVRRVHHFRIMTREGGQWLVASHIIMDERDVPGDAA
jgi:hypothetical protein